MFPLCNIPLMLRGSCRPLPEFNYSKQCLILQGAKNAFLVIQPLQISLLTVQYDWVPQAEFAKPSVLICITHVTDGVATSLITSEHSPKISSASKSVAVSLDKSCFGFLANCIVLTGFTFLSAYVQSFTSGFIYSSHVALDKYFWLRFFCCPPIPSPPLFLTMLYGWLGQLCLLHIEHG